MRRLTFAAAILLCANPLFAVDLFTLYVPVHVSHLHPTVSQINVRCSLTGRDPASGALVPYGGAGKAQNVTPTAGAYSGTLTFVFTNADFSSTELSNLSNVNRCHCVMELQAGGAWVVPYSTGTGAVTGHAPGTPFSNPVDVDIH